MKDARWEVFEGTRREVGFALGRYWAKELRREKTKRRGAALLDEVVAMSLSGKWTPEHEGLRQYLSNAFPTLVTELRGMTDGVCDGGIDASFEGLFRWSLGEAGPFIGGCSTLAFQGPSFSALAHNEEEDGLFPLCFAKVRIRERKKVSEFVSVSYPFQMFGSAVGANAALCFTGNSIKPANTDQKLSGIRLPKTIFTRLALEKSTIEGVTRIFDRQSSRLPGHWFLGNGSEVLSLAVRPSSDGTQIKARTIEPGFEFHTNHFHGAWGKGSSDYKKESRQRLRRMVRLAEPVEQPRTRVEAAGLIGYLSKLRSKTNDGRSDTIASIVLVLDDAGCTVAAKDYYRNRALRACKLAR